MKKIILLIVIILLGGCYDYRELNDMAIVDGILIDYVDYEYKVYLNVIKSNSVNFYITINMIYNT
jgi:hypothetical protein